MKLLHLLYDNVVDVDVDVDDDNDDYDYDDNNNDDDDVRQMVIMSMISIMTMIPLVAE